MPPTIALPKGYLDALIKHAYTLIYSVYILYIYLYPQGVNSWCEFKKHTTEHSFVLRNVHYNLRK